MLPKTLHTPEELTQDTFLRAKKHLETLEESEKVLNWMFRIASQLVAGWHRKYKSKRRISLQSLAGVSVTDIEGAAATAHRIVEEHLLGKERQEKLFWAIAQLPELEQKMFHLQLRENAMRRSPTY